MNKTALITGASKRIGRALTEHLAEEGWNVIIHFNQSEESAEKLEELLRKRYPNQQFHRVQANLQSSEEAEKLIPKVVSEHGEFQLLVNNASVFDSGYIAED